MKKTIILLLMVCIFIPLQAQISVTKRDVVCKTNFGNQKLIYAEKDSIGSFALSLASNNKYHGNVIVGLGDKEKALVTLKSMYEYENKDGDVIELNNPTNNNATYERVLGTWMFVIYAEHSDKIYGYLAKRQIKKMITALEEYPKQE